MGVKKENKKDPLPGKLCCGSGYIPLPKAKFTSAGPSPPVTASSSPCPCLSCPCGLKPRALLASGFPLVTEQHLQDTGQKEESEILIPIPLVPTLRCHLGLERSSSDWGYSPYPYPHCLEMPQFLWGPDGYRHPPDVMSRTTATAKSMGSGVGLPDTISDLARH